jgi:hypothetical protein
MISNVFNRRGLCGAISVSALLAALVYARGTGILVDIGYGAAIGGIGAGVLAGLLLGLAYFFNSDVVVRAGHAIWNFAAENRIGVIWAVRCVIVAFTASAWYSTTLSSAKHGDPLITPTEAAVFVLASAIASVCGTRIFLSILADADREALAPFAHVLGWFVVSSLCFMLLLAK